jgi:hypothetical protein
MYTRARVRSVDGQDAGGRIFERASSGAEHDCRRGWAGLLPHYERACLDLTA